MPFSHKYRGILDKQPSCVS